MSAKGPRLHTMLLTLLLVVYVGTTTSEWVEISQQHYRKPVRLTHNPTSDEGEYKPVLIDSVPHFTNGQFDTNQNKEAFIKQNYFIEDEDQISHPQSQDRILYSNVSITEHSWNRNKYKIPGNRIHIDKLIPAVTTATPEFVMKNFEKEKAKVSATIERVPHIASIKRVNLSDTPVKSPTITDISKMNRNNFATTHRDYDEFVIKSDIFKDNGIINGQNQNGIKPNSKFETFVSNNYPDANTEAPVKIHNYKMITSTDKPSQHIIYQQNEMDIVKEDIKKHNSKNNYDPEEDVTKESTPLSQSTSSENIIDNIDKILKFDNKNNTKQSDIEEFKINNVKRNQNESKNPPNVETVFSKDQYEGHKESFNNKDKTESEDIKVNTMENIMKIMKVITETISKNTNRGVNGKVKYLNELKDTLLSSIQSRIDATWPDDDVTRRRSRSTARGHVEFPSSESSLMTISFLTFAVFLIKLVLQVIQTYKNKTMVMAPLVVATAGRAVRKLRNFH